METRGGRSGFTVIEVVLFLAISGLLIAGLFVGVGTNIARRRYDDSVQATADELRGLYSRVADTVVVERPNDSSCKGLTAASLSEGVDLTAKGFNSGRGRSECVVYGLVASIHKDIIESTTLIGKDLATLSGRDTKPGESFSALSDLNLLKLATANNLFARVDDTGNCLIKPAGGVRTFKSKWGSHFKHPDGSDLFATLLIFRSPKTGAIRTLVMNDALRSHNLGEDSNLDLVDYRAIAERNLTCNEGHDVLAFSSVNQHLSDDKFKANQDLVICVATDDVAAYGGARRMIKINHGGRSSSAVEILNLDQVADGTETCE